ncbi:MAG: SDR family oxidoreductase [Rhizobiaceae bacterium]
MRILIFGAGFSGRHIGNACATAGATVAGTTRSKENFSYLESADVQPLLFDYETVTPHLRHVLAETTHLVISIAPPRQEYSTMPDQTVDPVLLALGNSSLAEIAPGLRWIGYLSTVGVYGDHDGAWINEEAPVNPTSERSRQRVRAEDEWQAVSDRAGIPLAIFRLSGIYGPGRNALATARMGKARRLIKKGQVFNRIHVSDIAAAVKTAARNETGGTFNITDDEPAPPQDVVKFAHDLMGRRPPPEIDFETADLSPMARSFYGENKRVSNEKSKSVLGLEYDWPNYRTALRRMWEEDSWR